MRFNSLAFRLFATAAAWTLLVLPPAGYMIYSLYLQDIKTSNDIRLKNLVDSIVYDSMSDFGDEPRQPPNLYEPLFEVTHSGWYWQIRPVDGQPGKTLVSPSLASELLPSPYQKKFPTDPKTGARWSDIAGPGGARIRTVELIDSPGHDTTKTKYSIIVAGPLDWLEASAAVFGRRLSIALALAGLGLVLVTLFQVRFGLLPLRRIEKGLASVRSGDKATLDGRLPVEIEPLQRELNALIESNQDIIDRARTQVGNLAHALKTPLAVITNEAREDKSPFAEKVAEQSEMMRDQITLYLDRAQIAARSGVIGRVTPVEATAEPLILALERIHRDKGVEIDMDVAPGAKFQGEKQDLEEMLGNLLDNACKWGRKSVHLKVAVEGDGRARVKRLKVAVDDDGPGLTDAQRAKIGKRGQRLDETTPGSGLGLSIVSDLAASYRGALSFETSAKGGLGARLDLPAA